MALCSPPKQPGQTTDVSALSRSSIMVKTSSITQRVNLHQKLDCQLMYLTLRASELLLALKRSSSWWLAANVHFVLTRAPLHFWSCLPAWPSLWILHQRVDELHREKMKHHDHYPFDHLKLLSCQHYPLLAKLEQSY